MESFPAGIGALRGSGRLQCHFRWHPQMPRQLPELVAPATGRFWQLPEFVAPATGRYWQPVVVSNEVKVIRYCT